MLRVPVLPRQQIRGWPKFEAGGRAQYVPLSVALTRSFTSDAHSAQYTAPKKERRIDLGVLSNADALAEIGGGLEMWGHFFDVDCGASHKALGGNSDVPAPDTWWLSELVKVTALLEVHPGLFVYRTKGGYRLVGRLAEPRMLRSPKDAEGWTHDYLASVAYLLRRFNIVADPIRDATRLIRLPHATRVEGGRAEQRETIGDPENVGIWKPELSDADHTAAAELAKKKEPKRKEPKPRKGEQAYSGDGVLFHALRARGAIRQSLEPGKWAIDCPRAKEHSKDTETGTILFAPAEGEELGYIHCAHSNSGHDRLNLRNWLDDFSEEELAAARNAAGVPARPTTQQRRTFDRGDHTELGGALVADLRRVGPIVFVEGAMHRYQNARGLWATIAHDEMSRALQSYAGSTVGEDKSLYVSAGSVDGSIKLAGHQVADPSFFDGAFDGIAFANGFLQVTREGVRLVPHSPEHRARWGYAFEYVPNADAPMFRQFLIDAWRDDADGLDKMRCLRQFCGACLFGIATRYQKCLDLVGPGADAKSTLVEIITAAMPPGTVTSVPPQDLGGEYYRAMLAGKLLNVVAELPSTDIEAASDFKAVVTGDAVPARAIREAPFMLRPKCGHMFCANTLPGTADSSEAFWRRHIVLRFFRVFDDASADRRLAEKITEKELPGVVAFMVDGAIDLLREGRLLEPATSKQAVKDWRKDADQVRLFADECTTPLPKDAPHVRGASAAQIYKAFRIWADRNGHRPMASNKFGARMAAIGLPSTHTKVGSFYRLTLVWHAVNGDEGDEPVTNSTTDTSPRHARNGNGYRRGDEGDGLSLSLPTHTHAHAHAHERPSQGDASPSSPRHLEPSAPSGRPSSAPPGTPEEPPPESGDGDAALWSALAAERARKAAEGWR